jgi:FeS assembly SUF system regulator
MIRMTRLTDYGILLLTLFAKDRERPVRSARDLGLEARLPLPTVSKLLKVLARHKLLEAHRGVKGGFRLARPAAEITVAEIIHALEGPIGVTECSAHAGLCDIERHCIVRSNWRKINLVVIEALQGITLAEMTHPLTLVAAPVEWRPGACARPATQKG